MGTHDELVHVPGTYRETALLQLMDLTERNVGGVSAERRRSGTQQRRSAETPLRRHERALTHQGTGSAAS